MLRFERKKGESGAVVGHRIGSNVVRTRIMFTTMLTSACYLKKQEFVTVVNCI